MAKTVTIKAANGVTEITIDGHVMEDVISYKLQEDSFGVKLILELYVSSMEVLK